jgi:signal peptidase II
MPKFSSPKTTSLKSNPLLQTGWRWLWIAVIFFIIDQVTKGIAVDYFVTPGGRFEVMPFFNFTLAYNKGAAFSFLADQGGWQVIFFSTVSSVVAIGILYWLYTLPAKNWWLGIALSLILGGAMGNLYDRLVLGQVVDFIDWYYQDYHFPAFNVADSVIFLGAFMMIYDSFKNPEEQTDKPNKA